MNQSTTAKPRRSTSDLPRVSILGAGRAGTALARALQRAGLPARIASTRSPTAMRLHLAQYAPQARAVEAEQIAQDSDVVVLMVPQEDLGTVDPDWLEGTIMVDATNRWEDEPLPNWFEEDLAAGSSSSEVIAARFPGATVVKSFNHISHWDLDGAGQLRGPALQPVTGLGTSPRDAAASPTSEPSGRRGLGVASDDAPAAACIAALVHVLGFDPVVLPTLVDGRLLEPGGPVFLQSWSGPELADLIQQIPRR